MEFLPPLARSPHLAAQRRDVLRSMHTKRRNFIASLEILGPPQIRIENNIDNAPWYAGNAKIAHLQP